MTFGHMFDIWNNILGTRKVVTSGVRWNFWSHEELKLSSHSQ
jgi:hypothetical protein